MKKLFALCLAFMLAMSFCGVVAFGADMETIGYAKGIAGVYSSGNQAGNHVYNIFDGSMESKWAHDGAPSVVWFKTDPNVTYDHVSIALQNGHLRHYELELAVYTAAGEWEVVWEMGKLSTGTTDQLERFDFTRPISGEWLRFTGKGSDVNVWNNISEMTGVPLQAGPSALVTYENTNWAQDVTVIDMDGKVYLPFVEIAKLQGFETSYDAASGKVTAEKGAISFSAYVDSKTYTRNGENYETEYPLILKDGQILIDIEGLGEKINYAVGLLEESHVYGVNYVRTTPEILKAFEEMEILFDKEAMTDLYINLYDPETGGFYFGTSAVGQPGYMPMIESTCQAYKPYGMTLDPEYQAKLGGWLQSMQDPETGWFLEPMYTENYNVETVAHTKKQRNLFMTEGVLDAFKMKPLYLTPTERLVLEQEKAAAEAAASGKPVASTQTATADQGKITTESDAYLQSEEAYLEWVKTSFDWDGSGNGDNGLKSCWQAGNEIGDFTEQLKQLGYWDSVSEFIRTKQRPHNGLFTDDISIVGISGVTKLSGMFDKEHPMQYMDKIVESAAWLAEHGELFTGSEPYNISLAIRYMFQTAGGMISDEVQNQINEAAPRFVRGLTKALYKFKKWDGGFGYVISGASTGSQGGHVIPAYDCADVNGNQLAMGCLSDVYWIMGMSAPNRFNDARLEAGMRAKQPITEPLIKMPTAYNYEDAELGNPPQGTSANNAQVVEDPTNWKNQALHANMYKHWNLTLPGPCDFGKEIDTLEFSIMPGKIHVNNCGLTFQWGQGVSLSLYISNGALSIYNRWDQSDSNRDLIASGIKQWQWSDIRLEYDIIDKDKNLTEVRCYVNGKLTGVSKNVYDGARDARNWPQADVSWAQIQGWSWGHCELFFDNVRYSSRKAG